MARIIELMKLWFRILILLVISSVVISIIIYPGVSRIVGALSAIIAGGWAYDAYVRDRPIIRPALLRLIGKRTYSAVILAAGMSERWKESIKRKNWSIVSKCLKSKGLLEFRYPDTDAEQHKSLAKLKGLPIIGAAFNNYYKQGITDISVVLSRHYGPQEKLMDYMNKWKGITPILASRNAEVATSAYEGLKRSRSAGEVIVSYSDIVWEEELLTKLMAEGKGDITVVVDTEWQENNYPPERIWHNEFYAELVFGENKNIQRIGEVINRFEYAPSLGEDDKLLELFKPIFKHNCIGEIVGLFKFTPKGRRIFCSEYEKIVKSPDKSIIVTEWRPPAVPSAPLKVKPGVINVEEALLGSFLEHLNREINLDIQKLEVQGGWVEIDHWGDLCIAEEKDFLNRLH